MHKKGCKLILYLSSLNSPRTLSTSQEQWKIKLYKVRVYFLKVSGILDPFHFQYIHAMRVSQSLPNDIRMLTKCSVKNSQIEMKITSITEECKSLLSIIIRWVLSLKQFFLAVKFSFLPILMMWMASFYHISNFPLISFIFFPLSLSNSHDFIYWFT